MPPPPEQTARLRIGLERAVALVGTAAIAVLAVFFVVIGITQFQLADVANDSRTRLVPAVLENHRMAINLHRMLAAGDLAVGAVSAQRRREASLNARAIAGHPAFLNNPSARALMAEASHTIHDAARQLAQRDSLPKTEVAARDGLERDATGRWLEIRARLEALADTLAVEAAAQTTTRFDTLAEGSRKAMRITLAGLATTIILVVILLLANRRWVVRPLVQAVAALRRVHSRQPVAGKPEPTPIAEFALLHRDIVAVRHLVEALTEAREELERSNHDLEQFAYVASHDLREPLRMVTGFLGLIRRRYDAQLDDEGREFIAFATEGATRMDQLIQDLLAYSRVGRQGEPKITQPLATTVQNALHNMVQTIAESGARIDIAPDLPFVHGDHRQLARLFQNLFGNAIKYCPAERTPLITVTARQQDKRWRIAVTDNGIGIEREHFSQIFLLFQRLHTRDKYPGTGLGLAICRKIAEYHGGSIEVESTPGVGSTFTLVLPA